VFTFTYLSVDAYYLFGFFSSNFQKMKICYLTYNLDPKSGWGRYSSGLINSIKKTGHEVIVLKENNDGLEGLVLLKRGIKLFHSVVAVRKYIKDCDVVHALDGYPYGIIATLASMGLKKKVIITLIGSYSVAPLYNLKTKFLLSWAYHRARIVISISNFTMREVLKKISYKKIDVIPPGVEFKTHQEGLKNEKKYVLSVGAVKYRKGYHISIPAFADVLRNFPDLKYKIIGDLSDVGYVNSLKQTITGLGLNDEVEFLGKVSNEELEKLYMEARLFILTSVDQDHHFEGFGIVYLEASAFGLAVIGCTHSGAEDAIKDNETGFLIPPNDKKATTKALLQILENPSLALNMGIAGSNWAKKHDWKEIAAQHIELYMNLA